MIIDWWIWKDVEEASRIPFQGSAPAFAWRFREKQQNTSIRSVGAPTENKTENIQDTSDKCYSVSQLAQFCYALLYTKFLMHLFYIHFIVVEPFRV
jgi:hypothetical protein